MPVITAISPQKKRKGRYSVFIDGEFFLGLDEETLYHAKIKEGQSVEPQRLKDIVKKEEFSRAKQYTLNLLSRRLYSSSEIRNKLKLKGYEEEIALELISDFESKKYLDDKRFAESWVEHRTSHQPRGPVVLRQELQKKGIDKQIIQSVLEPLQSSDDLLALAHKALAKKKNYQNEKDPRKRKQKIYQFLARKGFTSDIIGELIYRELKNTGSEAHENFD